MKICRKILKVFLPFKLLYLQPEPEENKNNKVKKKGKNRKQLARKK